MRGRRRLAITFALLLALVAPAHAAMAALPLTLVAGGFDQPIYVTHAGDERLFVVEQSGRIKVIDGGTVRVFLNISKRITAGGEQGLLGLAFHPNYASNGLFYVNYSRASDGDTIIAEYRRSAGNPNRADPTSRRGLMRINQPAANHNGGWMGFKGNLLHISTGDGGGSPGNRPQDVSTLLGKVLRINPLDPDGPGGPRRYSVPPKNPFVGRPGRDEIWSLGLRNPWRCSFDRANGRMWCADVGQNEWEEVNRVRTGKGVNYGWPILEGRECYNAATCDASGMRMPVAVYSHSGYGGGNCSVTGGYVSRRSGATLFGKYVFGDYCSGRVWAIPADFNGNLSQANHLLGDTSYFISSFGEGFNGRLYLVDRGGRVFRLNDS